MSLIPLPRMSDFLVYEFMIPMNLTAKDISAGTNIPYNQVLDILINETDITPELSGKLGTYFGISEMLLYNIQRDLKERFQIEEQTQPSSETFLQPR